MNVISIKWFDLSKIGAAQKNANIFFKSAIIPFSSVFSETLGGLGWSCKSTKRLTTFEAINMHGLRWEGALSIH
jgi:hypothetical protein